MSVSDQVCQCRDHQHHGLLLGDVPRTWGRRRAGGPLRRYASPLVRFIKPFQRRGIHADKRGILRGCRRYPEGHAETPNRRVEMDRLKAKVEVWCDFM